jgi:hypothetical protein
MMIRPSRVPLSAFIVEDMMEFVHAHATYRFVISDEEDERPRLLVSCILNFANDCCSNLAQDMVVQAEHTTCLLHAEAVCLAKEWIHTLCESALQDPRTIHCVHRHERVGFFWD